MPAPTGSSGGTVAASPVAELTAAPSSTANPAPMATPSHEPATPSISAPTNTNRMTCQRVAPATRNRPTSRARSPTVIDSVFTITNAPTNRTIAAMSEIVPWKSLDDARMVAARSAGVARMYGSEVNR